jgi:hypothetical protein
MCCDARSRTAIEAQRRVDQLKRLEQSIMARTVQIVRVGTRVELRGWTDRGDWTDACVLHALQHSTDFRVRTAVQQATGGMMFAGHSH